MDMVILEYRLFSALFYFACFEHMCSWLPKGAQISIVDFAIYWNWNINDQIDARELYAACKKKKIYCNKLPCYKNPANIRSPTTPNWPDME